MKERAKKMLGTEAAFAPQAYVQNQTQDVVRSFDTSAIDEFVAEFTGLLADLRGKELSQTQQHELQGLFSRFEMISAEVRQIRMSTSAG